VVLVVDDDPSVRSMTARLLQEEGGFTVLQAAGGDEALELCAHHSIAVVVTDMVMPRMGGSELGRRIKQRWPRTQVLFVTGYAEAVQEGLPGELMVKPYSFDKFVAGIQRLADRYWRASPE
jgi:CheY-like chemotaxis protein